MPDRAERRQSRRYPIQLPLLLTPMVSTMTGTGAGWTRQLSEGGAGVELPVRLSARTLLRVRLRTDRGLIEADAQVVWSRESLHLGEGILHGVAFTHIALDELQALSNLLVSQGVFRPAGVRLPCEHPVTCQLQGQTGPPLLGRTRDISRGGVLLRLPQVVPSGTTLELTLHTRIDSLTAEGTVIWVAPPEGRTPGGPILHGLRFTPLGWASSLHLAFILTEGA